MKILLYWFGLVLYVREVGTECLVVGFATVVTPAMLLSFLLAIVVYLSAN